MGHQRRARVWRSTYLRHEAGNSFDSCACRRVRRATDPRRSISSPRKTSVRFDMPLVFPDYHAEAPGGTQGGRSMVARPFDGNELGDNIKNLAAGATRTDGIRDDAGIRQGDRALHARDALRLQSASYVAKRLSKHFAPGPALRPRHDPDERQRACRPPGQVGLRSRRSALAVLAGKGIDRRGRQRLAGAIVEQDGQADSGKRASVRRARLRRLPARYRPPQGTVSPRADRARSTTRQDRPVTPATACDSPRAVGGKVEHQSSARRRLGSGFGHDAEGRHEGSDAALHRSRQARRHRGDARAASDSRTKATRIMTSYRTWSLLARQATGGLGLSDLRSPHVCANTVLVAVAPFPLPMGRHLRTGYLKRGATLARARRKDRYRADVLEATVT